MRRTSKLSSPVDMSVLLLSWSWTLADKLRESGMRGPVELCVLTDRGSLGQITGGVSARKEKESALHVCVREKGEERESVCAS